MVARDRGRRPFDGIRPFAQSVIKEPMTTDSARSHWTEELEHAEALDGFMAAAMTMQALNEVLGEFLRVHVIVDSNFIFADIIAILRKNSTGRRRPATLELLAKRTLVGYFPAEKLPEMHEKCVEISTRYKIPLPQVLKIWEKYQSHLHLVPTRELERERADIKQLASRDPSDVAFLQARHIVGASVVLTNDVDIHASGAPVMPWSRILLDLRHHSRKEGIKAAIFFGTGTAVMVPVLTVIGVVHLIWKALKSIPGKALGIAAVGIGIALLIPQSRRFLFDAGKRFLEGVSAAGEKALPILNDALMASARAEKDAQAIRPRLERELGAVLTRHLTLTQAVYRACLINPKPMTVGEIWKVAAREGARSRAKDPLRSVLRALKRHPLLRRLPDGRWEVAPMLASQTTP